VDGSALAADPPVYPVAGTSISRRIEAALDAIERPRPRAARASLEDAAVALVASRRPDWGEALLRGA
jgi:hypothetical protein